MISKHHIFSFLKTYLLLCLVLAFIFTTASIAIADHPHYVTGYTYPNNGFLWMSVDTSYDGHIYVSSNNCNSSETDAYDNVENSTIGTSEMSRWSTTGLDMDTWRCDGVRDTSTDIVIDYYDRTVSGGWGINYSYMSPSSYCQAWNETYPCGTYATVYIDINDWNAINATNRERLIMHETGHSNGLAHHCNSDSIMNDGTSSCNSGTWTAVMDYLSTDREGIDDIY